MSADDALETIQETSNKRLAVYIALLAALLAINNVGGSNAGKELLSSSITANDLFSFYQSKVIRQNDLQLQARSLELSLLSRSDLTPETRAEVEKEVAQYRAKAARYESEPDTGEGKKELLAKARLYDQARDTAARQDPYFDMAEALLQLAIVLASVSAVVSVGWLLWASAGLGLAGTLSMIDGFTLLVPLPWL